MANLTRGEYHHRDELLARYGRKAGTNWWLSTAPFGGKTPVISSTALSTDNWTIVASGLTGVVSWRLSELGGNDFYYAFVLAPGDNFSVAFGWVAQGSGVTNIYAKRVGSNTLTIKAEVWT